MKITQSNIRSVVFYALLFISLGVLQTYADDDTIEPSPFVPFEDARNDLDASVDDEDMDDEDEETVTTTTTRFHKAKTKTLTPLHKTFVVLKDTATTTTEEPIITSSLDIASQTISFSTLTTSSTTPLPSNHKINNSTTIQYTNTSDPLVQYDLECQADDLFCSKVSRAVGAAIDEFSRVIYVKNSLLIKVRYYSFCEKTCANDTLGWGAPTSQFILPFEDGADLNYAYPQALAKQLAPYSNTSAWSIYDIEIEINHDAYMNGTDIEQAILDGWNNKGTPPNGKFWFFNDSNTSSSSSHAIQSHQVDIRYVVLHELLHGLGFLSSWAAYFYTDASPFRELVNGVFDPLDLQLVTPGLYWYVNQNTGPAYVTGFQPTMIFDKYLVNLGRELNVTKQSSLSDLAFDLQDFCVQNENDAFIVNFIRLFNSANQSITARKLWLSMSQRETIRFQFQAPTVANSSYNLIPYLNKTYQSITLLTGGDLFTTTSSFEQTDATLNRPGLAISHLDDQYASTPDFLMTQQYHQGKTLEDLVEKYYDTIPVIKYNTTKKDNNTMVEVIYKSPIGPGVLRILDSIGYSTVLTKTNYTTDGIVKTPKARSLCEDSNTNHAKASTSSASSYFTAVTISHHFEYLMILLIWMII